MTAGTIQAVVGGIGWACCRRAMLLGCRRVVAPEPACNGVCAFSRERLVAAGSVAVLAAMLLMR